MPTIGSLPLAASLAGTDLIPVDQVNIDGSSTMRRASVAQLSAAIGGGGGSGSVGSGTITSAALSAALVTLLQSLPTAPVAGNPQLWNNSGSFVYS